MKALSSTQQALVDFMRANPGQPLIKLAGGFWTTKSGIPANWPHSMPLRGQWWTIQTVRGLVKLGILENMMSAEWNGQFILKDHEKSI